MLGEKSVCWVVYSPCRLCLKLVTKARDSGHVDVNANEWLELLASDGKNSPRIEVSDIPGPPGSPAVLPGVFSQLPGSCLIGVSHFPYSGPEVLRSSFPGPSSSSHLGRDVSGPLSQR